MIRTDFNQVVETAINRSKDVLIKKNDEYASSEEVFANFKQGLGVSYHNIPEAYAWELLTKHLQSVKDIIKDIEAGKLPSQVIIDEKFGDVHNYFFLIEGMIIERTKAGAVTNG